MDCYVDFLLSEGNNLTEEQLTMLVWESIIETSDTTLVTTEWAMYELAKNPNCQVSISTLPLFSAPFSLIEILNLNFLMLF